MLTFLAWVLFGAIAGWVASLIMNNREGLLGNIILGILGAVIGGFLMSLIGAPGATPGFSLYSLFVAVLGSVVLIWFGRFLYH